MVSDSKAHVMQVLADAGISATPEDIEALEAAYLGTREISARLRKVVKAKEEHAELIRRLGD